ncbi:hypothetical protein [Mycolicibacterium moriokaense]|uniref:hypothetical protein n=1 Tax=Mycolicibacterium moriokaense TaxID=39691 RepID=UPI0015E8B78D|nr:hypothetical protein [Mycolicibacterium moriokaense]
MRRGRRLRRFTDPDLARVVVPRRAHRLRHLPIVVSVVALLLLASLGQQVSS